VCRECSLLQRCQLGICYILHFMNTLLRSSDVAKKAGLTRQQVHRLAHQGKIPGAKLVGKQYRFDGTARGFVEWLKDRNRQRRGRKVVVLKGELPSFLHKGPPFKMGQLIEDVGLPDAIRLYADWIKVSLSKIGGASALNPSAKYVLKRYLEPLVSVYHDIERTRRR
jgi:excisionase family DNA binding protein